MNSVLELVLKKSVCALSFQMRMSVRQVVTGVTPTLVVATLSALISASATRASMEMDTLVLVGKRCVCFPHVHVLVVLSVTKCPSVMMQTILACASSTWVHSTHQTPVPQDCPCFQTLMSAL